MPPLYKVALCEVVPLDVSTGNIGLVKTASGSIFIDPKSEPAKIIEAEIKKHPTALFFRAKAIKANEANSNGDYFSVDELLKSYKTFEGVPFFTNHDNQNVENARGKVIYAEWMPKENAVYTISFVDREAYPHICRSIEEEYITGVSMGASVEYSICNICGNRAEKTEDFCSHIRDRKGRKFSGKAKNVKTGEIKEFKNEPVFEYNYGIKFIELSAVVDPACPSCKIQGLIKNDEILKKVANVENGIYMIKSGSLQKEAGQQEIQQLNDVLKTLEGLSIQLIQNRQQIEVEFASDLVNILSELQTFVDELIGAGYGNTQAVPGVAQPPGQSPELPPSGLPSDMSEVSTGAQPSLTSAETQSPMPATGVISGAPTSSLVKSPKLPITAPAKPRNSFSEEKLIRVAANLKDLSEIIKRAGDADMSKRLTFNAKNKQKEAAKEILSNSWKEKQDFLQYINRVPSIQNNEYKLSVKKGDDSFVIVAENKNDTANQMTWTFDSLNDKEKALIKESPKEAASYFMETFASNLKCNTKEGETVMSNIKEAGAKSVNKAPEVITEAQLDTKDIYHARTDKTENVITQSQLDGLRSGEKDVVTQSQLNDKRSGEQDVITEAQLEDSKGVSPRQDKPWDVITQSQLDSNKNRSGEQDVITERQLDNIDTPWQRAAKRDVKLFKSAGDHMKAVIDVVADTVISTGCTPEEARQVSASLIGSTKDRFDLGNAILSGNDSENINFSKRLAYWSKKNIKVAGVGTKEIAETLIKGLSKVASDITINPEVIIDAMDVVSEDPIALEAISKSIDSKLASATNNTTKMSTKDELRKALAETKNSEKETRDSERKEILASVEKEIRVSERKTWEKKASKNPDHIIETSFDEIGCHSKDDPKLRSTIKSFAKGALAASNIKLAAITNVTISGDTISIAVQTDEGDQAVELPVGENEAPMTEEIMPEGDIAGEGLENSLGNVSGAGGLGASNLDPATGLPKAGMPAMAKAKKTLIVKAQTPPGGQIPPTNTGTGAGVAAPEAGIPGADPVGAPVESLTMDESAEGDVADEIPTAGTQQPPWAICPECGSDNVDVVENGVGNTCNECGAEYDALIKKNIEFTIKKRTRSEGEDIASGEPEIPEVPALPVAAQTRLNKDVIKRIASNKEKHGHVCPACGMKHCKASVEKEAHTEYTCPACKTDIEKDLIINVNNPQESYSRVKWDLTPDISNCPTCKEAAAKFASVLRVQNMIKTAAASKFPKANCMERIAKQWGGNAVATFGPCKGQPLADCVCTQLEKLGLTKVRHLQKLAGVYAQKDPMDDCVEDQMKQKRTKKEAETICNCLKRKFASKEDSNVFLMAFADDIKSGKEKILTAQDLDAIQDVFEDEGPKDDEVIIEDDIDIGEPIDEVSKDAVKTEETVTIEVSKDAAQELKDAVQVAVESDDLSDVPPVTEDTIEAPAEEFAPVEELGSVDNIEEEKEMAMAMQTHKIMRVGEEIIKIAATPTKVESIEGNVEAKVPRSEQKLGEESKADSLMNKPNKGPNVPRKDAYMGKEKAADSLINKELKLPDVAVDSSYMGKNEKSNQSGMPAINNEIKGTVIAESIELTIKDGKIDKIAKKMQEVDTVEGEVEAKVPRKDQKLGEESKADSMINEPNKGPDVPRKDAYMGGEKSADSLINKELNTPDVPIDNAYMGDEKAVQKDMPGISDKYLKNVQQKKDIQLERIAAARRMKAIETSAKLLATKRIPEEAYDNVVEALSKFEIDKIASVADSMYPKLKRQAADVHDREIHAGTAIVMESKDINSNSAVDFSKKLSSCFTIGNKSFDENLTRFGEK